MNQEIKAKWLEALRSGRYEQGTGRLRSIVDKYCCLGVLEDVVNPEGWSKVFGSWAASDNQIFISDSTSEQAGLTEELEDRLMKMNDINGCTFAEIADWIETNL